MAGDMKKIPVYVLVTSSDMERTIHETVLEFDLIDLGDDETIAARVGQAVQEAVVQSGERWFRIACRLAPISIEDYRRRSAYKPLPKVSLMFVRSNPREPDS